MDRRGWSLRLKVCLPRWRSHASRPPAPPPCCTPTDHPHRPPSGNPHQLDHIPVPFHRGHGHVELNNLLGTALVVLPLLGQGLLNRGVIAVLGDSYWSQAQGLVLCVLSREKFFRGSICFY